MPAVTLAMLVLLVACGGGGSDSKNEIDAAKVFEDAPAQSIDAPPAQMGIGQPCTVNQQNMPQGDCPVGFECLANLTGGSGNWCSKTCTRGAGTDMCAVGYTGPGRAQCVYDITSGQTTRQFCGIVCNDTTGSCPATQCNDTCPAPLMCKAELMNGQGMVTGKACF